MGFFVPSHTACTRAWRCERTLTTQQSRRTAAAGTAASPPLPYLPAPTARLLSSSKPAMAWLSCYGVLSLAEAWATGYKSEHYKLGLQVRLMTGWRAAGRQAAGAQLHGWSICQLCSGGPQLQVHASQAPASALLASLRRWRLRCACRCCPSSSPNYTPVWTEAAQCSSPPSRCAAAVCSGIERCGRGRRTGWHVEQRSALYNQQPPHAVVSMPHLR